jgi:hypothetical protein
MPYALSRLAPGSYDVLLDGMIIASLVRSRPTSNATWTAVLLVDVHPRRRSATFTATRHTFSSLEDVQKWLGGAEIQDINGEIGTLGASVAPNFGCRWLKAARA